MQAMSMDPNNGLRTPSIRQFERAGSQREGYQRSLPQSRSSYSQMMTPMVHSQAMPLAMSRPDSAHANGHQEKCILQFCSDIYIVEEDEGVVTIDIMRLGPPESRISCYFRTADGSGVAGSRYEEEEGELIFEKGEMRKSIEVGICNSEDWEATLEFKVHLSEPQGCSLGSTLHTTRVKVLDCDTFPSSRYPEVGEGEEAVGRVAAFSLFYEYCKMNFHVPGIAWRSMLCLVMDQLKNAYLFYKLSAMVYMLNVLFSANHVAENPDFTTDQRVNQAMVLGAGYILPMIVLYVWDLVRIHVDVGGHSRCFLQQNIVRKYLNYDEDSRSEVLVADIQLAVREDAASIVEGYTAVLSLLKSFGKLWVMMYFTINENPDAVIFVIIMPALMFVFGAIRNSRLTEESKRPDELGASVIAYLGDTARCYSLVADYQQRPQINEQFANRLSAWQRAEIAPREVRLNNDYFTQLLGPVFVGMYIMTQARLVLNGDLGHGTFVATLSVFSEISSDFGEGYSQFMKISSIAGCLKDLTILLNRSTDLQGLKKMMGRRKEGTRLARRKVLEEVGPNHPCPDDLLPLAFVNVGFRYVENCWALKNLNLSVKQGSLVAIQGKHSHGRQTFLRLIGHKIFATEGEVVFPEHLRILHVGHETLVMDSSIEHNLTFGLGGDRVADHKQKEKVLAVLKRLGVSEKLIRMLHEEQVNYESLKAAHEVSEDESDRELDGRINTDCHCCRKEKPRLEGINGSWRKKVGATDQAKLHLARAILVNPQIMVLQRPLIHFNSKERQVILKVLRDHVENRGLGLPKDKVSKRRPRTVFFSVENVQQAAEADVIWALKAVDENHVTVVVEPKGSLPAQTDLDGM